MECKQASADELREAFAQVHSTWPHADHPEVHLQKRLASIHHGRAEWWVLRNGSGVVASCGAYPLTLFGPDGDRKARGFGAVFTRPDMRAQGCAAKLLRFVMDSYHSKACSDFILFSDIDPRYYERLGFHKLSSWRWEFPAEAFLPEASWSLEKVPVHPDDPGTMDFNFGIRRSEQDKIMLLAKESGKLRKVIVLDGQKQATGLWILSSVHQPTYELLESNIPQDRPHWALFRTLVAADAAAAGCTRATGWWTARHALDIASAEVTSRQNAVLMWTSLKSTADSWLPRITEEGFRVFQSEHF
jgi:predicted N-acetyltransferase YhbS